jgi:regulator of replication initiation timing
MQQSQDLKRAKQSIEAMLNGKIESPTKDSKPNSEKSRPSPTKSKTDLKAHFSEPPAPPPSAPLPEKPDVARALADPIIQPLLRRSDTARPPLETSSPTKIDHSSDILQLCEALKLAKGELTNQSERMKSLEDALAQERTARESAEERAQRAEQGERRDSPRDSFSSDSTETRDFAAKESAYDAPPDLQAQLDRLRASMDEMKTQMESYRRRAEAAEGERDEARQTLAEMVEQKRREAAEDTSARSPSKARRSPANKRALPTPDTSSPESSGEDANGHAISPTTPLSPTSDVLLERAGVEEGQPITPEQAKLITQVLAQEVLNPRGGGGVKDGTFYYHGRPIASAAVVVLVGVMMMTWMNGWPKVER